MVEMKVLGFNRYIVECKLGKGALTSVKALAI